MLVDEDCAPQNQQLRGHVAQDGNEGFVASINVPGNNGKPDHGDAIVSETEPSCHGARDINYPAMAEWTPVIHPHRHTSLVLQVLDKDNRAKR